MVRTLLSARVRRMDPKPGANALSIGARWHFRGNLKVGKACPNAGLIDGKDGKVLRLDILGVGFVGNSKTATGEVVNSIRVVGSHGGVG